MTRGEAIKILETGSGVMNRITSDNTFEMNMCQLALNQVYIGDDGWVRYRRAPEDEVSVCDLIRTAAEALGVELPILSDEDLSSLMADWLQYGEEEPEGVLAILYRALCAMAEVRAKLSRYEDTGLEPEDAGTLQKREQGLAELLVNISCGCAVSYTRLAELAQAEKDGRLVVLPCKVGDTAYRVIWSKDGHGHIATATVSGLHVGDTERNRRYKKGTEYIVLKVDGNFCAHIDVKQIGKTVFLTREEAEAALKKREEAADSEKGD